MNRQARRRTLWLLACIIACTLFWWLIPSGVRHRGKPAESWFKQLTSSQETESDSAKQAVREMGTNIVPLLIEKLRATDSALRSNVTRLVENQPLVKLDLVTAQEERRRGLKGLLALGSDVKSFIPELMKLLDDPVAAESAAHVLTTLDNEVIPSLVRAAGHTNPLVRRRMILDLGYRHALDPGVVACLVRATEDPNFEVRGLAAYALSRYPTEAEAIVPVLLPMLSDSNSSVRAHASQSLSVFGERAKVAVPALLRVVEQDGPMSPARRSLQEIDPITAEKSGLGVKPPPSPYE